MRGLERPLSILAREFLQYRFCELFVDFAVAGNGLGNARGGIVVPVMLSAVADQDTTHLLKLLNELLAIQEISSSATRLTEGRLPLVNSS